MIIDNLDDQLLRINFNITTLDLPCEFAVIDVVDALGTRTANVAKMSTNGRLMRLECVANMREETWSRKT